MAPVVLLLFVVLDPGVSENFLIKIERPFTRCLYYVLIIRIARFGILQSAINPMIQCCKLFVVKSYGVILSQMFHLRSSVIFSVLHALNISTVYNCVNTFILNNRKKLLRNTTHSYVDNFHRISIFC